MVLLLQIYLVVFLLEECNNKTANKSPLGLEEIVEPYC